MAKLNYKTEIVEGLECIIWTFDRGLDTKKKRAIKDSICRQNLNKVALDRKGRKYCDAIVICEDESVVLKQMMDFYQEKGYTFEEDDLPHRQQMSFLLNGTTYFNANVYPTVRNHDSARQRTS